MSIVPPDQWQALQTYLDAALGMPDGQLPAWLASVRDGEPALADELETLLNERTAVQRERFLEDAVVRPPVTVARPGDAFGAYALVSPIAEGGMGSVWLAERSDGRFARRAAVKLLRSALLDRGVERFAREAQILARLTHPHIAQLIDAGASPSGQPYLVLEHVDGVPVDQYCDAHALPVEARVRLFLDVLQAVAHAHANLVVHRDIKPSNVLVTGEGEVKLLDFGVAKLLENERVQSADATLKREVGLGLTLEYAAPEQLAGAEVSTATDVYSLGVLLFVLLTGQHPAGPGPHVPAELIKAIAETEPPRLGDVVMNRQVDPERLAACAAKRGTTPPRLSRALRGDLEAIVATALKKTPAERYASVGFLADDLGRHLGHEPVSVRTSALAYRASKFARRNRGVVSLAVLALLVSADLAGIVWQAREARLERDAARRDSALLELRVLMDRVVSQEALPRLPAAGGHDNTTAVALFSDRALALNQIARPLESEPIFRRAIELTRSNGTGQAVSAVLLVDYAHVLLELGRFSEAASYAARGYLAASEAGNEAVVSRSLLLTAAICRRQGDLARADALLTDAERRLRRTLPPGHIAFAALVSQRSLLAQARGDVRAGFDLSDRAVTMAEAAVTSRGQGTHELPVLLVRRSDIELGLGRAHAAEADAARAVRLIEGHIEPGTSSAALGRADLALGRALLACGRRREARDTLAAAVQQLRGALGADHSETLTARQLSEEPY